MILDTDTGEFPFHAVTCVRQVAPYPDKYGMKNVPRVAVHCGREIAYMTAHAWENYRKANALRMIPAQPGTYTLFSGHDMGEFYYGKTNVIAWAITIDGQLSAITADGINDGLDTTQAILHPDGQVDIPGDRAFDTLEQWEKYARKAIARGAGRAGSQQAQACDAQGNTETHGNAQATFPDPVEGASS